MILQPRSQGSLLPSLRSSVGRVGKNPGNEVGDVIPVCTHGQGGIVSIVSHTVLALPNAIETRPRYLGWHRTLIISLVVDCDYNSRLH